jgi:hypothetical protein
MTSRSSFAPKRRPLSAIFLGDFPAPSASTSSELPDLPEPPSPGASSSHSGLPSPPATNSTGSGSTGDSRENVDLPSVPHSSSALTSRDENPPTSRSNGASSPAGTGEYKRDEGEDEEDNTARLNFGRHHGPSQSNDHVQTLQRVMSLTQRNRQVRVFYDSRVSFAVIFRLCVIAYRPSTNSLLCASTHLLHPKHLIPHVLLIFQPAPRPQVPQPRPHPAPAPDQWNPQHYQDRRQSASPVLPILIHPTTNP